MAEDHPAWAALDVIEDEHRACGAIATHFSEFSELDERFHRLIHNASRNRFIIDFYDVIAMIFHYHYQWNKVGERERNSVAVAEHLAYIDALKSRDRRRLSSTPARRIWPRRERPCCSRLRVGHCMLPADLT